MKIGTFIRFLAQLFTLDPEDDIDSCGYWIAEEGLAALIDFDSGRVLALIWSDESGRFDLQLFTSPLRAWRLWQTHQPRAAASLLPHFPRVLLDLPHFSAGSLWAAQTAAEVLLTATE